MLQKGNDLKRSVKNLIILTLIVLIFNQNGIFLAESPHQKVSDSSFGRSEKKSTFFPLPAAFREDKTIFSKQLINDSGFDLSPATSPWNNSYGGDLQDVTARIENGQSNSTIIGDTQTVSIIANFSQPGEWTPMRNPQLPTFPQWEAPSWHDSYGNDTHGLWANHTWVSNDASSSTNQRPSINWARNISLPLNISDHKITSVSIKSQVNASVDASGTYGLEVLNDAVQGISTGDYAQVYVRVADLARTNVYELAYNRTPADLGLDSHANPDNAATVDMTTISENFLKAYLASVLSQDFRNFTIILGIDFCAENNQPTDRDRWDMMRINTLNLTFTLEKIIDYNSQINWNETGYMINSSDYLGAGDEISIAILNATLNFQYRLTQPWPVTSPNSEIRVNLNNFLHSETIKLNNGTTGFQAVKGGSGFDVSSLIFLDQNVTIKIQVIMLDTFLLPQNVSLLIDNISLTVYFLATIKTIVTETLLQLVGPLNIVGSWNESLTVVANYTQKDTGTGIPGANITLGWVDIYTVDDIGSGLYNIECNTTQTLANQRYTLIIYADAYGNESKSYMADIQIVGRPTYVNVFIDQVNRTSNPNIMVPWNKTVNITAFYYDTLSATSLTGATVNLTSPDIDSSAFTYGEFGDAYIFTVNSSDFGAGSHLISLLGFKTNYAAVSLLITLTLTVRPAFLSIYRGSTNVTQENTLNVPKTGTISLDVNYYDAELGFAIDTFTVSLQGLEGQFYNIIQGLTAHLDIYTTNLDLGVYIVSVLAGNANYSQLSHTFQVNVNQIKTSITTSTLNTTYSVTTNGEQEITLIVMDTDFNQPISGCVITYSYSWKAGTGVFIATSTLGVYKATIQNIPEGVTFIYITVFKGPTYQFESLEITLIGESKGGIDIWVVYSLIGAIVAISLTFIQYQLVWKYPKHIRKVRRMISECKSGKVETLGATFTFRPREALYADAYFAIAKENLSLDAQNQLKNKYLTKRVERKSKREPSDLPTRVPKNSEISQESSPSHIFDSLPSPSEPPTPQKPASVPQTQTEPIVHQKTPEAPTVKPPLPQVKELPAAKPLPPVKELPAKPATKPAPKPEDKPGESAGNEQK